MYKEMHKYVRVYDTYGKQHNTASRTGPRGQMKLNQLNYVVYNHTELDRQALIK